MVVGEEPFRGPVAFSEAFLEGVTLAKLKSPLMYRCDPDVPGGRPCVDVAGGATIPLEGGGLVPVPHVAAGLETTSGTVSMLLGACTEFGKAEVSLFKDAFGTTED